MNFGKKSGERGSTSFAVSPTMANNSPRLIKDSHFAWQTILAHGGVLFPVGVLCTSLPPTRCEKKRREIYWRGQTTSGRAKGKEYPTKNQQAASQLLADSSRIRLWKKIPPDSYLISCILLWIEITKAKKIITTGFSGNLNDFSANVRVNKSIFGSSVKFHLVSTF